MLADVLLPPRFALGLLTLQVTVFDADWHLLLLKERLQRTPPMLGPRRREQAHSCHIAKQNVVMSHLDWATSADAPLMAGRSLEFWITRGKPPSLGRGRALSPRLKALITNREAAKHPFRNGSERPLNDCHLSTPCVKDADQLHMGSNRRLARICQSSCGITDATDRVIDGSGCGPGTAQIWKKPSDR
jgi:hypothetical protein